MVPGEGLRSPGGRTTLAAVPIHLRASPNDYAPACLLPGDPLRARYISERFFESPRQVNGERGLLGYTGTFRGRPVSVQATGMGGPSAAIVIEELIRLGVRRMLRIGTCGSLQPSLGMGELVVALSAVGSDGATRRYVNEEPHAPTADWTMVSTAVRAATALKHPFRVGPVASSDVFYDPEEGRLNRWAARGVLAVEMEAAVTLTLGGMRGVPAGCLLVVSDLCHGGTFTRISDEALRAAVDVMTEVALVTVTDASAG